MNDGHSSGFYSQYKGDGDKRKSEELKNTRNRNDQYAVPLFIAIQENNTCLGIICPCLFSKEKYKTLNIKQKDLQMYYKLKALASLDYNQYDQYHEEDLKFLYLKAINSDFCKDLISDKWEKIGFNSWNPREDFKEGGYYSLLFITHFVYQNEVELNEICALKYFHFALVAIKITFYFKLAFDLLEDQKLNQSLRLLNQIKVVNVPQFKAFLYTQSKDKNSIFYVLSRIIVVIKNNYLAQMNYNTNAINDEYMNNLIKKTFDNLLYPELDREYEKISISLDKSYDATDDDNDLLEG